MGKFLLLFIIITISEVYLMKVVAEKTGFLFLLAVVMFTGFLGLFLAKVQGRMNWQKMQEEVAEGRIPGTQIVEGLMILVAAAVLITPGFITDFLGFMLLVPWVRKIFAPGISKVLKPKTKVSGSRSGFSFYSNVNIQGSVNSSSPPTAGEGEFFDMPSEPEQESGPETIEDKSNS